MSAAVAAEAPPPARGKKKLIIIIAAAVLVLACAGGGAVFMLKKKAAAEAEAADTEGITEVAGDSHAPVKASAKHDPKAVPVFVPLDPFTVNLADREAERYAQIGITLEIEDAKTGDQIKNYMPAIRNNILLAIADRTAAELMGRDGKTQLAEKIKRETSRVLGVELEEDGEPVNGMPKDAKASAKPAKKKTKTAPPPLPVKAVHFSNFIIQ